MAVPRQAPLAGSDRAARGAIVRLLGQSAGHRIGEADLRGVVVVDDAHWARVIGGLERDRLVHRAGDELGLGAATIGP